MKRRRFVQTGLGAALAACTGGAAADRPRSFPFRVLYSNDTTNVTSCVSPYHAKGEPFSEAMFCRSIDEAAAADAHLLQPGMGWIPWWKSQVYPAGAHYRDYERRFGVRPNSIGRYMIDGGDLVRLFIDHCRRRGVAPFISLRMNDAHGLEDVGRATAMGMHTVSRFYEDHYLQWRLGPNQQSGNHHVLDWAVPEVRDHKFAFVRELAENYDFDGFELDFLRHPAYFRADMPLGKRRQIMADFVRRTRQVLDQSAAKRRRWLSVRMPAVLAAHDRLGLDPAALVDAGCDVLNLSYSYPTVQPTDLGAIRRRAGNAALFLEMTHTTLTGPTQGYDTFPYQRTTPEQFYTTADLAYRQGADGVSLFNFVYYREHGGAGRGPFQEPPFEVLPRLAQPQWLAAQPRWYFLAASMKKPLVENWPLPRRLGPGENAAFSLPMAGGSDPGRLLLRLRAEEDISQCRWQVRLNGQPLEPAAFVRKPLAHPYEGYLGEANQYATFTGRDSAIHNGTNVIEVALVAGTVANLIYLDVVVPWPNGA